MNTLGELVENLSKAVKLYDRLSENNGMDGDVELAASFEEDSERLKVIIKDLTENYYNNEILGTERLAIFIKFNTDYNRDIEIAFKMIKDDYEREIKELTNKVNSLCEYMKYC